MARCCPVYCGRAYGRDQGAGAHTTGIHHIRGRHYLLEVGCHDTLDGYPFPMAALVQCHRGLLEISSWPRCVSRQTHSACTGRSYKAMHSSPRRTKSGTRRLSWSDPLHIVGLMFTQSILRNAAIPNYLIPMPFQKVTRL